MITKNQIKTIKSLSFKKNRLRENLFIAEGEKVVAELLDSDFDIDTIYATKDWVSPCRCTDFTIISNSELKRISNQKNPNKVLAIAKIMKPRLINKKGVTLVLDGINDPGNMGTIIRICDWFGVTQIVCSNNTVDMYNAKVVQAAMGSLFRVHVFYTDLSDYLKTVKTPIYGAFMKGRYVKEINIEKNSHLIMGNEANGISDEINKFLSVKLAIKKIGKDSESLNVAAATSILLHEFCS